MSHIFLEIHTGLTCPAVLGSSWLGHSQARSFCYAVGFLWLWRKLIVRCILIVCFGFENAFFQCWLIFHTFHTWDHVKLNTILGQASEFFKLLVSILAKRHLNSQRSLSCALSPFGPAWIRAVSSFPSHRPERTSCARKWVLATVEVSSEKPCEQ